MPFNPMQLLRFWREGTIALLVLVCGVQELRVRSLKSGLEHSRQETMAERAAHKQTVQSYRAAAETARLADAENKARIEAAQNSVSKEVSDEYREKLADLRRRFDTLRLRAGASGANPGSAGTAPVPGLPEPPGGANGSSGEAGLPPEDALIASEIALRLQALQAWALGQDGIDRSAPRRE